jgi:type IV secretion system protein VirB11
MNKLLRKNLEPLQEIIDNLEYKEVVISRPYHLHIETIGGKWIEEENKKLSLQYLYGLSRLLAVSEGKRFNEEEPILSASIDGKHRVNVVYGKQTNHEISLTIRLKRNSSFDLSNFEISEEDQAKLKDLIVRRKNILISGGTGTGKTTLLNALVKFIPLDERIVTIENAREIEIEHKNHDALIYLEDSSEKIASLLNATLRMRPDRILIGELRNENSYLFLRAANSGHEGTLSTIHANDPRGAIDALIHNIKSTSRISHDEHTLRKEIEKNIDVVVQLKREYRNNKMVVTGYLEEFKKC